MEALSIKLKRNSKLSKNLFNSSIRKFVESQRSEFGKTGEAQRFSIVIKGENEQREPGLSAFPVVVRRKRRFNSAEMGLRVSEYLKKSSFQSNKNVVDVPLDFTRSLTNSSKGKLLKDEESLGFASSRFESAPQTNENKADKEEYKILSDFSSFGKIKSKVHKKSPQSLSKTNSFEVNSSDFSIIVNKVERVSLKPFIRDVDSKDLEIEEFSIKVSEEKIEGNENTRIRGYSKSEVIILNFDEALFRFNSSPVVYTEVNIWIKGFLSRICCFDKFVELSSEYEDLCEKLIIFAYTAFDVSNAFHSSLLLTVFHNLQSFFCGGNWEQIGFISNNPHDNELKHDVSNFGLLLVIFLDEFLPSLIEHLLEYCKKVQLAFVSIVFDVAEMSVYVLRMKKLNRIMMESQKCLEILFFFAAGCLAEWFNLHKEGIYIKRIASQLENKALNDPKGLINLARDLMCL